MLSVQVGFKNDLVKSNNYLDEEKLVDTEIASVKLPGDTIRTISEKQISLLPSYSNTTSNNLYNTKHEGQVSIKQSNNQCSY